MSVAEPKVRRIKYALERSGAHGSQKEDIDNPMSPNFLVLDARNEREKARWWAMHGKKNPRNDMGVMEADLGVI